MRKDCQVVSRHECLHQLGCVLLPSYTKEQQQDHEHEPDLCQGLDELVQILRHGAIDDTGFSAGPAAVPPARYRSVAAARVLLASPGSALSGASMSASHVWTNMIVYPHNPGRN